MKPSTEPTMIPPIAPVERCGLLGEAKASVVIGALDTEDGPCTQAFEVVHAVQTVWKVVVVTVMTLEETVARAVIQGIPAQN